jgi:tRNA threonylcarbamoyladenosine modification (KEOPS) complex  Pcc1 subunit
MYTSTIIIDHDIDALDKLFASEDKNLGRSSFNISIRDDKLLVDVKADDAVAFKTVMNTLAKVLIVWEKSQALSD